MDEVCLQRHLSELSTCWTMLAQAHGAVEDLKARAQAALIERYQTAIYRYLVAALRDPEAADELFQEFALRVVSGAFAKADPERGRFRDYVKTSLAHLISWHRTRHARGRFAALEQEPVARASGDEVDLDGEFLDGWRKALLDRAWQSLARRQREGGPPFHAALQLRTELPDLPSGELAQRLNAELVLRQPLTEAGLRKVLQRARELFTDFLIDEIQRSLPGSSFETLEQEVIDLGFHAYCRRALDRRRVESSCANA